MSLELVSNWWAKSRRSPANVIFVSDMAPYQQEQEQGTSLLNPSSAFDSVEHADFLFNWD